MLAIGVVAYRRTRDLSDYMSGGRNLGPVPSALSASASDMSTAASRLLVSSSVLAEDFYKALFNKGPRKRS